MTTSSVREEAPPSNTGYPSARVSGAATTARPQPEVEMPQPALRHAQEAAMRLQVAEERTPSAGPTWTNEVSGRPFGSNQLDLREIMAEVGLSDFREDEYDIPTFLRKQAD